MGSTEGPKFEKMGAIILHTADIIFTIYYVVIKRYKLILVIFLGFYDSLNISTCFYILTSTKFTSHKSKFASRIVDLQFLWFIQ